MKSIFIHSEAYKAKNIEVYEIFLKVLSLRCQDRITMSERTRLYSYTLILVNRNM